MVIFPLDPSVDFTEGVFPLVWGVALSIFPMDRSVNVVNLGTGDFSPSLGCRLQSPGRLENLNFANLENGHFPTGS